MGWRGFPSDSRELDFKRGRVLMIKKKTPAIIELQFRGTVRGRGWGR